MISFNASPLINKIRECGLPSLWRVRELYYCMSVLVVMSTVFLPSERGHIRAETLFIHVVSTSEDLFILGCINVLIVITVVIIIIIIMQLMYHNSLFAIWQLLGYIHK